VWWYTPLIPTLGRLTQEGLKFKGSLGYRASKTVSQKTKTNKTTTTTTKMSYRGTKIDSKFLIRNKVCEKIGSTFKVLKEKQTKTFIYL
jgi:hypothetical protein